MSKFGIVKQKDIDFYHRKPRAEYCKLGHKFTVSTSYYSFHSDGMVRRTCKICTSKFDKIRYSDMRNRINKRDGVHWTELLLGGI